MLTAATMLPHLLPQADVTADEIPTANKMLAASNLGLCGVWDLVRVW